jgi:hypothetical protein
LGKTVCKQAQQVGHRFAVMASWRVGGLVAAQVAKASQAAQDDRSNVAPGNPMNPRYRNRGCKNSSRKNVNNT